MRSRAKMALQRTLCLAGRFRTGLLQRWGSPKSTSGAASGTSGMSSGASSESKSGDTPTAESEEASTSPPKSQDSAEGDPAMELKELQNKYMRALAETENVRQRLSKQVQEAKLFGIQGFAKELLNVADVLENANNSISDEILQSGNKPLQSLVQGLKLTEAELQKVFKANGLTKINGEGEKFDPALHEAVFEVAGDHPGTVAMVSQKGYMLHGRTLRPAKVGVVKTT